MKNYLLVLVGVLSGLAVSAIVIFLVQPVKGEPIQIHTVTPAPLMVYVDGAVKSPGIYELQAETRIEDAIKLAGGLSIDAELSSINPASKITDGQKIYVPSHGETPTTPDIGVTAEWININTATLEELCELPGIGESKAKDIIHYREEHGDFLNIKDITNVPGIGESIFDKIEKVITVN